MKAVIPVNLASGITRSVVGGLTSSRSLGGFVDMICDITDHSESARSMIYTGRMRVFGPFTSFHSLGSGRHNERVFFLILRHMSVVAEKSGSGVHQW